MPFLLDGNPSQGEISEAINYLLSNFSENVSSDQGTGQIIGPGGEVVGYLYKYMFVKYADSFDGSVGFSNTPTNKGYYGLRNSDDSTESTNPVDYLWTQVTGGFGTTKFLYYLTTGGRQIQFQVATAVPNAGWKIEPGTAIDLDITLATSAVANFVVIRLPNNSSAPTDAECVSAIGRTPISGDLCTINYNSGLASIQYKYTTGWAIFQKYITADIVEAQTLSAFTANLGTITGGDLSIGSSPVLSGTAMTGTGAHLYSNGNFAFGNATQSFTFNGSQLTLNGIGSATTVGLSGGTEIPAAVSGTAPTGYLTGFSITKPGWVILVVTGDIDVNSNGTSFPGFNGAFTFSVYQGTTFPGTPTGVTDTIQVRLGAMVFKPAFGSAYHSVFVPVSWTRIVYVSTAGTYSVAINGTGAFYDSAGNVGYNTVSTDRYFYGRASIYQPTI